MTVVLLEPLDGEKVKQIQDLLDQIKLTQKQLVAIDTFGERSKTRAITLLAPLIHGPAADVLIALREHEANVVGFERNKFSKRIDSFQFRLTIVRISGAKVKNKFLLSALLKALREAGESLQGALAAIEELQSHQ